MKLYSNPLSPNCAKVLAAASHLGIPLEIQLVKVAEGENRKPEYLKLNPNGKIPTLVDGDFALWESNAIMRYLAGKKPNSAAWPNDERLRADISRWQDWELAHWFPACRTHFFEHVIKQALGRGEPDLAEVKKAEENFHRFAGVLDTHLAGREYLVGKGLTLADLSVGIWLAYTHAAKLPVDKYTSVKRWYSRLEALPAWQQEALPKAA
jgi:glutathione S-transferase